MNSRMVYRASDSSGSRDRAIPQVAILNNGETHYMASLRNKNSHGAMHDEAYRDLN